MEYTWKIDMNIHKAKRVSAIALCVLLSACTVQKGESTLSSTALPPAPPVYPPTLPTVPTSPTGPPQFDWTQPILVTSTSSMKAAGARRPVSRPVTLPSTATVGLAAPTPAKQDTKGGDTDALASQFLKVDERVKGSAAVSAPSTAKEGQSFRVLLRVSPGALEPLRARLKTDVPSNTIVGSQEGVQLVPRMTAVLKGMNFETLSAQPDMQAVSLINDTTWGWDVKPLKSGIQHFTVELTGAVTVEGKDVGRSFYSYSKDVSVAVSWNPGEFISKNWQTISGTMVIPFIGAIWAVWRKKKFGF